MQNTGKEKLLTLSPFMLPYILSIFLQSCIDPRLGKITSPFSIFYNFFRALCHRLFFDGFWQMVQLQGGNPPIRPHKNCTKIASNSHTLCTCRDHENQVKNYITVQFHRVLWNLWNFAKSSEVKFLTIIYRKKRILQN